MYRDFFTNKWVIGGVAFLIVLSVACVLWYRYDTAADRKAAAETAELLRQWAAKKADPDDKTEQAADASVDSTTPVTEKPISSTTDEYAKDTIPSETHANLAKQTRETKNAEEVRVSPHGFGPYPEIPKGAPVNPFTGRERRNMELLMRVVIKKWNEGERFTGASFQGGEVYLNYPNTVYVRYGEPVENEDGTFTRPIISAGGSNSAFISEYQMRTGQIPSDLRVLEYEKNGIDPYEYLDLP